VVEMLVALGVADHRQAFHLLDAKAHLYFEDKPDERILSRLFERCGHGELLQLARAVRLRGAGDAIHLPTFARMMETHFKARIPKRCPSDRQPDAGELGQLERSSRSCGPTPRFAGDFAPASRCSPQ